MQEKLIIEAEGGYFEVVKSLDSDYPGVDIEFFSDNEDESTLSRPRILFEKPKNGDLRALVWNDSSKEDFEVEIGFK